MNYNKHQITKESNSRELDKKKSRNLEPSSAWLKEWEWLEYCEIDETLLMFCKWCKEAKYDNIFTRGTDIFKRDIVKRHEEKDQKHQKAKQQFAPILPNQLFENDRKIIHQMKCVYFAAKKHLSFNVYPDLCSLISSNNISLTPQPLKFPSQELVEVKNYGSYLNSVAARNFAEAIVHVIETSLINEIKLSVNWSIMIDESTSMDEKHLVIASQHMAFNTPIIRYLGLIKLEDCKSESIMEALETFIINKNLCIMDISHFGSDGASTMTGKYIFCYFINVNLIYY
jgi:hypothetical protein